MRPLFPGWNYDPNSNRGSFVDELGSRLPWRDLLRSLDRCEDTYGL